MEVPAYKEIVEELKDQWKLLWWERIDDKVRAEGIANKDFSMLFIDKGTVIFATRDFKQLSFREILQLHKLVDLDRIVPPCPSVGGWGKFIRTMIASQNRPRRSRRVQPDLGFKKERQQLKKSGRGWLHF